MGPKCQPWGKWASQIAGGHLSKGDLVALERGGEGFSHRGLGLEWFSQSGSVGEEPSTPRAHARNQGMANAQQLSKMTPVLMQEVGIFPRALGYLGAHTRPAPSTGIFG